MNTVPSQNTTVNPSSTLKKVFMFLCCVILAFAIWIYAVQADYSTYEQTFPAIPVSLINTSVIESDSALSIISGDNTSISVTIVGKKEDVSSITESNITATADVSSITAPGVYNIDITVKIDGVASVKGQSSMTVSVYVDKIGTRTVPVTAKITNAYFPANIFVGVPEPHVHFVTVSGPEATLKTIDHALATVDFQNQMFSTSITSISPLSLISATGSTINNPHLKLNFSEVEVDVSVFAKKEVPLVVSFENGYWNSDSYILTLSPSTIEIQGEPSVLEKISEIEICKINEKTFGGLMDEIIPIPYPAGVSSTENIVDVELTLIYSEAYEQAETTISLFSNSIVVDHPVNNYKFMNSLINVVCKPIQNNADKLKHLNSSYISVHVDLASYNGKTGEFSVPCTVTFLDPFDSLVYEVGTTEVQVQIK